MDNRPINNDVYKMTAGLFGIHYQKTNPTLTLPAVRQTEETPMAVFPVITSEAFAMTMANFRNYIAAYNMKTRAENELTEKHNKGVDRYGKITGLNDTQKKLVEMFTFRNQMLWPRQWNDLAEEFCAEHGAILPRRKIQTVKPVTEQIFQNLLHLYNSQLLKRNCQYKSIEVYTPRPLQELKINAYLVTRLKRDDVKSLDFCAKTIRTHRQRLEEAGVFVDYHFSGRQRPVDVRISPKILCFHDFHTGQIFTPENQRVNLQLETVLPDTNESTGTILKESEIKANVENNSLDKEFAPLTPKPFSYKNTAGNMQKSDFPPPPAGVKVCENMPQLVQTILTVPAERRFGIPTVAGANVNRFPSENRSTIVKADCAGLPQEQSKLTVSERLTLQIIHPQDLAIRLAAGEFNSYVPIDIRLLFTEAFRGTMSNDDFRELFIQDFFKQSAKLYRNSTPVVGAWKNALNLYYDEKFKLFNGNSFTKSHMIDEIVQLRWRLEYARRWFSKNPNFNVLFPSQYFDFTRKTAKEGGFEYTVKAWSKHRAYQDKSEFRKRRMAANADKRKKTINHSKKFDAAIRKLVQHKFTVTQLFDYVAKNLPQEYYDKLPVAVENFQLQHSQKSIDRSDLAKYNLNDF